MSNKMTIREAAAECRKWAHGSRNHQDAIQVLFNEFRRAHPGHRSFISLDILWSWVESNGDLTIAKASLLTP